MLRLARDNIVALPVHDSFIVRASHLIDLKEEMNKAYKEVITTKAVIKKKESVKEESRKQEQQRPHQDIPTGDELYKIIQDGVDNYKQYNRRESEWRASRGYP